MNEEMEFHKLTLEDSAWVRPVLEASDYRGSEYTFANLYLWSAAYGDICRWKNTLSQRMFYQGEHQYLFPAGCCDFRPLLRLLREDSHAQGHPFVLRGLTKASVALMKALYPEEFTYEEDRDAWDYLYEIENLAELKGKKYQAKRNHINRFAENFPDWYTEEITQENLPVCRQLFDTWMEDHREDGDGDKGAIEPAFAHFRELEFEGIILYATPEQPVAFSMGNRISKDTFDVNFEKAYASVQGSYPLINREFARFIQSRHPEIRYLNREDDMGLEGLRKAKESYHPVFLEKFVAREIAE